MKASFVKEVAERRINHLWTSTDLLNMTRSLKRHTLMRPIGEVGTLEQRRKNYTALTSFFLYTRDIIPRIEE